MKPYAFSVLLLAGSAQAQVNDQIITSQKVLKTWLRNQETRLFPRTQLQTYSVLYSNRPKSLFHTSSG